MEGIIALLWLVAAILGIVQFVAVLQLFGIRKDLRLLTEHLVSGQKKGAITATVGNSSKIIKDKRGGTWQEDETGTMQYHPPESSAPKD